MIDSEKQRTVSKRLRWSLLECVWQTLLCVDSMRCAAFCCMTPLGLIHDICYLSQLTTLVRYSVPWRASGPMQFDRRSIGRVGDGEEGLWRNLRTLFFFFQCHHMFLRTFVVSLLVVAIVQPTSEVGTPMRRDYVVICRKMKYQEGP